MRQIILIILLFSFSNISFAQEWTPLFNGQNLEGWTHVGKGKFVIKDGILKTKGGMGLLYYNQQAFENAVIKVVYKNPEGKNAGVYIRIPEKPTEPWMPVNKGYEVQIDDNGDDYHRTGVLYSLTKAKAKPKRQEWNTMEITLDGNRTKVTVNGELITDFKEGDPVPEKKIWYEPERGPRPLKGYIGLQNHGKKDVVYFKEISYKPIPPKPKQKVKTTTTSKYWAHKFATVKDVQYGKDPAQRLDIHAQGKHVGEPKYFIGASTRRPTLIYFHGGGWVQGNKESNLNAFIHYLERGWNVINVEYRLGNGTAPQAAEDALEVMRWLGKNHSKFNIDTNNVVVSGKSAGGHLALLAGLATTVDESHPNYVKTNLKVKAIINWFGITHIKSVEEFLAEKHPKWNYPLAWLKSKEQLKAVHEQYSPVYYVSKNAPAILTIHGQKDELVPFSQATKLHLVLEQEGAKNHSILVQKNGNHGGFTDEQYENAYERIFKLLEKVIDNNQE